MPRVRSVIRSRHRKRVNLLLSNPHLSKRIDSLHQGDKQVSASGDGTLPYLASVKTDTSEEETSNDDGTEGELGKGVLEEDITRLVCDLRRIERHLNRQMKIKCTSLSTHYSHIVYFQLSVLTAASLIIFNKPRAREVMHLTVKSYKEQPTKIDPDDEILQSLSTVEKKLCERFHVVKTLDKEGNVVPILLTARTRKAVDLLVENRSLVNIKRKNPLIFANLIDTSVSPVEILNTASEIANLANPGFLQDTRLDKHVATISQILVMQFHERKWLSCCIAKWEKVDQRLRHIQKSTAETVMAVQLLYKMDSPRGYHSADETLSAGTVRSKVPKIPFYERNLFKTPTTLPAGLLLTDGKESWLLGSSVGRSGFGELYHSKLKDSHTRRPDDYSYLIKVEVQQSWDFISRSSSVPDCFQIKDKAELLLVVMETPQCWATVVPEWSPKLKLLLIEQLIEVINQWKDAFIGNCSFLLKAAVAMTDLSKVDSWKQRHGLSHLAIPKHVAFGEFEHNQIMYHFVVFEKVGCDLQDKLRRVNHQLDPVDAYNTAIQLVDAIEYLHSIGFIEADINPTKIMETHENGAINKVVLVDFGLAMAFMPSGRSRERFARKIQKLHNCALEYMSRDAHNGDTPTKRSDIETLAYNLIHWLSGKLPWKDVKDKNEVSRLKTKYMEKIHSFFIHCFGANFFAPQLHQFLEYVRNLDYEETPSYSYVRQLFKDAMKYHFELQTRARSCKARKAEQLMTTTIPSPRVNASWLRTSKTGVIPPLRLSEQTKSTLLARGPRLSDKNISYLKRKSDLAISAYSMKHLRICLNSKEVLSHSLRTDESVSGESKLMADEGADSQPAACEERGSGVMLGGDDVDHSPGVTIQVKIEPDDSEYYETEIKGGTEGVLETWTVMFEDAMPCDVVKSEPESEENEGVLGMQQKNTFPETMDTLSGDDVKPEPDCETGEDVPGREVDQSKGIQQGKLSPESEDAQKETEKFDVRSSVKGSSILEDRDEPIEEKYSNVLRKNIAGTLTTATDVRCASHVNNYAERDNMKMKMEAN